MPLTRNVYDVDILVDDRVVELRGVILTHGDELRAELEGHKRMIPTLPLALTSLMLWAACVRLGHYSGVYDDWRNGGLVEYRRVTDDELAGATEVDPTNEVAPSGPASSSQPTSPASSTGSPPTWTTA